MTQDRGCWGTAPCTTAAAPSSRTKAASFAPCACGSCADRRDRRLLLLLLLLAMVVKMMKALPACWTRGLTAAADAWLGCDG